MSLSTRCRSRAASLAALTLSARGRLASSSANASEQFLATQRRFRAATSPRFDGHCFAKVGATIITTRKWWLANAAPTTLPKGPVHLPQHPRQQ